MSNSNESNKTNSNHIKTGWVIAILIGIAVVVVALYVFNFHKGLSVKNDVWGQFGDYVGGILNPVIAAFAFYLIAKSYELQKRELEATRNLLEVSTNAQKEQIALSALTALLNLNLTKIETLEAEKSSLLKEIITDEKNSIIGLDPNSSEDHFKEYHFLTGGIDAAELKKQIRINDINEEINKLICGSEYIENKIKKFCSQ